MEQFISPLALTDDQRKANLAALNARMARATSKIANDKTQSKRTRAAAARDLKTALRLAEVDKLAQ
jgi:hypothetical protein